MDSEQAEEGEQEERLWDLVGEHPGNIREVVHGDIQEAVHSNILAVVPVDIHMDIPAGNHEEGHGGSQEDSFEGGIDIPEHLAWVAGRALG